MDHPRHQGKHSGYTAPCDPYTSSVRLEHWFLYIEKKCRFSGQKYLFQGVCLPELSSLSVVIVLCSSLPYSPNTFCARLRASGLCDAHSPPDIGLILALEPCLSLLDTSLKVKVKVAQSRRTLCNPISRSECWSGYCYHLFKFHIYALVYCIGLYLSGLLHSV